MSRNAELGRIGQLRYGVKGYGSILMEEFLPELRGTKGVQVYTEMADNDATIGSILFAIEMLMGNTDFKIEPGGDTEKDKECAEFVESCLYDMERTWPDTLSEIMSFMTYGWAYHEIVYKRRVGKTSSPITNSKYSDGLIGWRKLPPRAQDTLEGWEYKEGTDDLIGMTQLAPPDFTRVTIPLEKALHFRTRSRKDNPEGRSILRTAYRAYYFKKRLEEIEGYGMERDLAGFPLLYAPADLDIWDDDPDVQAKLAWAERMVSSIRRDALEGLVLPGGYEQGTGWKLELLASSGKRQFDTNAIIERYDKRIATTVLADFTMLGQEQVGSFALADSKTKIFALAIGSYLNVICEVFNHQAIPRLIDLNGDHFKGITDYPKMTHGDIDEQDIVQFATYIKEMVGIGVLEPDEELEKEVRRVGNLPEKLETDTPKDVHPGEEETEDPEAESKTVYKVTSIVDKYQSGKLTRNMAAKLLANIGTEQEDIEFYLSEADTSRQEQEKKRQEEDKAKARAAAQKPTAGQRGAKQQEPDEDPEEDEKDAQKAAEAKKSLGRSDAK